MGIGDDQPAVLESDNNISLGYHDRNATRTRRKSISNADWLCTTDVMLLQRYLQRVLYSSTLHCWPLQFLVLPALHVRGLPLYITKLQSMNASNLHSNDRLVLFLKIVFYTKA